MATAETICNILFYLIGIFIISLIIYVIQSYWDFSFIKTCALLILGGFYMGILSMVMQTLTYYEKRFLDLKSQTSKLIKDEDIQKNLSQLSVFIIIVITIIALTSYLAYIIENFYIKNALLIFVCTFLGFLSSYSGDTTSSGEKTKIGLMNSMMLFSSYYLFKYVYNNNHKWFSN